MKGNVSVPIFRVFAMGLGLALGFYAIGSTEENPQVKKLMQEGLRLYGQNQFVRALEIFKQIKALDPGNDIAEEYIKTTQQKIVEWELESGENAGQDTPVTWDTLTGKKKNQGLQTDARDIVEARKSLVERMKNRSMNMDNIVQVDQTADQLVVTLFHDQLFLPGLQILRDEALTVLANVAEMIRTGGNRKVTIVSASHSDADQSYQVVSEFSLPAADPDETTVKKGGASPLSRDLETARSLILFTYLAQESMGTRSKTRSY